MNKTILIGHLTRNPELTYLQTGMAVCNNTIAVNTNYKNKQGEKVTETCFIDITLFSKGAERMYDYLSKGSKVCVEGRLVMQKWETKTGEHKTKHIIVVEKMEFLDSKNKDKDANQNENNDTKQSKSNFQKELEKQEEKRQQKEMEEFNKLREDVQNIPF